MQFILKILAIFVMVCSMNSAFAQLISYTMKDRNGNDLGFMQIIYHQNGYEAKINGTKASFLRFGDKSIASFDGLQITIWDGGNYWHNRTGITRRSSVTTSSGEVGFHEMLYVGMTKRGRLYQEDLWLEGKLFSRSQTVIDQNDHLVWSTVDDQMGHARIDRL